MIFGRITAALAAETHARPDVEIEERLRVGSDEPLGQRRGLGEERPVPISDREGSVGAGPDFSGRNDVEDREPLDPVGMVDRHAVGHASPAVVARHGEAFEAQCSHRLDLVTGHRSLAVRGVVGRRLRSKRHPIPRQIRGDDGMPLGEDGCGGVPHLVRLRIAVQQQQRRAAAPDRGVHRSA